MTIIAATGEPGRARLPRRKVVATPPPDVGILEFKPAGPVLAMRPCCHTEHYWQVYFDGNRAIRESLAAAGLPAPMPAQLIVTR